MEIKNNIIKDWNGEGIKTNVQPKGRHRISKWALLLYLLHKWPTLVVYSESVDL